ncbi:DNA polymerase Y family protein [Allonocardiopsis opalescens]|uniref:Protein ImuB n=1 Tax=Allonocardiopsis opalescens TaxID=1144618 RepID=A0A2T0QEF3_9ACTN|nr:DNA polymerase Y family protein [Allonocardiopsis opalescens]PRY02282.1 protein ImuB [Allonocardiopsis opalescens]
MSAPPRVLVVWCPDWPVRAVRPPGEDGAPEGGGPPVAVVAGGRVVAASAAARAAGVRRGRRVRDAQRDCAGLAVRERDPGAEARLFERVASAVEELCPRLEVVRPGLCAVPAAGPARYYGGEAALVERVRAAVAAAGFDCAVGVADGTFAAGLAARHGQAGTVVPPGRAAAFLAPHPIAVLGRPELAGVLVRLGVDTLGGFAALPGRDVLARFGADGLLAHRLASGREPRPPAPRRPSADLSARMVFEPPAERADQLLFAAKALAEQLHERLAGRGLACVRVGVEVVAGDGRGWRRLWRHGGRLSASAVAERVRWQLEAWRAPGSDSGEALSEGVAQLRLVPDHLVPAKGGQRSLWGRAAADEQVERAVARLQGLLGHGAVTLPYLGGGRGPAERALRVPFGDAAPEPPGDAPWPGRPPDPAPAAVPPRPLPAELADGAGAPVAVSGRGALSAPPARLSVLGRPPVPVTAWAGPWPSVEYWWDPDRSRRRARLQVVTEDGRAWLLLVEKGRWYAEASYD